MIIKMKTLAKKGQYPNFEAFTKAARAEAKVISSQHPRVYFTISRLAFSPDLELVGNKRLHVFAPSDAEYGLKFYYLNGKEKPFSQRQIIADQNATPSMS